jgi:hypothetical protein
MIKEHRRDSTIELMHSLLDCIVTRVRRYVTYYYFKIDGHYSSSLTAAVVISGKLLDDQMSHDLSKLICGS